MMTHDQIIEVVQAHKEGKKIQVQILDGSWHNVCGNGPHWNFESLNYRVAAREWWVNESDYPGSPFDCAYKDQRALQKPLVHVREVLDKEPWPDGLGVSVHVPLSPRKPREGWIFPNRLYGSSEAVASSVFGNVGESPIFVREVID